MLTFVSWATDYIESVEAEAPPFPPFKTFVNNKTSTGDEIL
jgi:hypothetical protein